MENINDEMKQAVKEYESKYYGVYEVEVTESKLHRFTVEAKDIEEAKKKASVEYAHEWGDHVVFDLGWDIDGILLVGESSTIIGGAEDPKVVILPDKVLVKKPDGSVDKYVLEQKEKE